MSKLDQIKALGDAKRAARSNPFEDAARGRDPAPKSSDGGVGANTLKPSKRIPAGQGHTENPVERNAASAGVAPSPSEAIPVQVAEPANKPIAKRLDAGRTVGSNPATGANSKSGRPLAKDAAKSLMQTKPWLDEGMSRASWYRRQAEQREKK